MSPLRRRKGRQSRARARRQQLIERERLAYRDEPGTERRRPIRAPRLGGLRSASSRGARATVRQAQPAVGRLIGASASVLRLLVAWLLRFAGLIEGGLTALLSRLATLARRALALGERHATPERVLVVVIGAAAGCLVVSQFVAYRGVQVGGPQYSDVSAIAPAPQTARVDAGAAHAYVLIPLAAIALAIAVLALASGRWRLGRLVSLIGLIGIAVSLAIDLPKGLDAGTAGVAFAGAQATLTDGFYAQVAASAALVFCGLVLSLSLRQRAGAGERRPSGRRRRPRPRRAASVAEGGV